MAVLLLNSAAVGKDAEGNLDLVAGEAVIEEILTPEQILQSGFSAEGCAGKAYFDFIIN